MTESKRKRAVFDTNVDVTQTVSLRFFRHNLTDRVTISVFVMIYTK